MGSKLWWGGTGIQTPDFPLESQECNHYATGAASKDILYFFLKQLFLLKKQRRPWAFILSFLIFDIYTHIDLP